MRTDKDLLNRNVILSASPSGITVQVNGKEELLAWDNVAMASATIVEHCGANIFALAILFDDVRTFIIGEVDAAWPQVIENLPSCLPSVEPFSSWGPKLLAEPALMVLFERE